MFCGKNSFFQKQDKANHKAGNTQKTTTVTNALGKPKNYCHLEFSYKKQPKNYCHLEFYFKKQPKNYCHLKLTYKNST